MHILLVEDSHISARLLITFLKEQGYTVDHASNGKEAIEYYKAQAPDLVLMDVVMPEMDGIEATRHIKALGGTRWVPVMLMTALSAQKDIVAGLEAGADDYLIKPINFEVLRARMHSMQRIATIQDSLIGVLDNVYEAILTIDESGIVQSYNKAAERIFGYTATEVMGRNVKMLMPDPYANAHDGYLSRYLSERIPHIIGIGRKVEGIRKNGQIFPMRLSVTEVQRNTGSLFIGLVSDISAEETARQHIEFLAWHDALTGLPNRASFNNVLDETLRQAGMHALLFIDLDGFKPINDTLGHEAGDEALKIVANRLRNHLASTDFVARLGGDEFVAIVHKLSDRATASAIAQRLLSALAQPMTLLGKPGRISASIGIAIVPEHGTNANDILTTADNAMYIAKRSGKGIAVVAEQPE